LARPYNPVSHEAPDPRAAGSTWTGGQYSLVRALFGAWQLAAFARLLLSAPAAGGHEAGARGGWVSPLHFVPNLFSLSDEPWLVVAALSAGCAASVLFAVGAWHRTAAAVLAYAWSCISTRFPWAPMPGMPWILVLLLCHLALPPAPYGSWVARGRADPEGAWRMHLPVFQLAWGMQLLGSVLGVVDKLSDPPWSSGPAGARALLTAGILFEAALPIAVFRRRPRAIAWSAIFLWRLIALCAGVGDDRLRGMLVVHLYSFDPRWLPPVRASAREHLFFDGTCGLCHRVVRFVAAEDRGSAFFYSPLQGEAIRTLVAEEARARLPDSVVVRADDGRLLLRSDAWVHVLRRIGGAWRAFGTALSMVPRPLRDAFYAVVARTRYRLFARPKESCPLLSSRLRTYFLP
jgi:predicted DCC family thiol-disulfide oxidoreductase YuxK